METDATILIFYSESAITSPHLPKTRSCIELSKFKAVWGGRKVSPQPSTERKILLKKIEFMFDKGQKLACINDDFSATVRRLYRQLPRKDGIYTVRDVRIGRLNVTSAAGGGNAVSYLVLLEELHNPDDPYMRDGAGEEMGFRSDRFAPLEEIEDTQYAEKEEALIRIR
jgi:hypothetical protein